MSNRFTTAAEHYLADLHRIRASGGATGERSVYIPIANLLNAVGSVLKPKVFCVAELADHGAGHPNFGLYAARRIQKGRPRDGRTPECGVVEVKPAGDDAWVTAASDQVKRCGTCALQCCERCSSSFPIPARCSHSASTKCSTGPPRRSTAWSVPRSSPSSAKARRFPTSTNHSSKRSIPSCAGSWGCGYTPPEVVRYMVDRVDKALKDDLGVADGLAADNVYVLDPCCGTGAYLAEVLRRLGANLER